MNIFDNIAKNVKKATVPAVESLTEKEIDGLAFAATTNEDYDTLGAAMEALGVETVYSKEKVDKDDLSAEELHQLYAAGMEDEDPDDYEDDETIEALVDGYIDEAYADEADEALGELTEEDLEDIEDDEGMESYLSAEQLMEYEAAEEGKIADGVKNINYNAKLHKSYKAVEKAYKAFLQPTKSSLSDSLTNLSSGIFMGHTAVFGAATVGYASDKLTDACERIIAEFVLSVDKASIALNVASSPMLWSMLIGMAGAQYEADKKVENERIRKYSGKYRNSHKKIKDLYEKITEIYNKIKNEKNLEDKKDELVAFDNFCKQMARVILDELKKITKDLKSIKAEAKENEKNNMSESNVDKQEEYRKLFKDVKPNGEKEREESREKRINEAMDKLRRRKEAYDDKQSKSPSSKLKREMSNIKNKLKEYAKKLRKGNESFAEFFEDDFDEIASIIIASESFNLLDEEDFEALCEEIIAEESYHMALDFGFDPAEESLEESSDRMKEIIRMKKEREKLALEKAEMAKKAKVAVDKMVKEQEVARLAKMSQEERMREYDAKMKRELALEEEQTKKEIAERKAKRAAERAAQEAKPGYKIAAAVDRRVSDAGDKVRNAFNQALLKRAASKVSISTESYSESDIDELVNILLATEGFAEIAEEDYEALCEEIIAEEAALSDYPQ